MNANGPVDPRSRLAQAWADDNSKLLKLTELILLTTPGVVRMLYHPELDGWAKELVAFYGRDELRPLEQPVKRLVSMFPEGAPSLYPFFKFLAPSAFTIRPQTLLYACQLSAEIRKARPYASFILAWIALAVWVINADIFGENLHTEGGPAGRLNEGWIHIPAACIAASLELNGLYGASLLAENAYTVLQTYVRRRKHRAYLVGTSISEYRRLGKRLSDQYQMAIAGLADDLHEACRTSGRACRLVAALLWTMGRVPECLAINESSDPPRLELLRRLIQSSFQVLRTDSLIQYLWLEMKDIPELDLRAHDALYVFLNHCWDQCKIDQAYLMFGLQAEPSRLYARTLASLLAGDLDEELASEYLRTYEVVTVTNDLWGNPFWVYLMPRMRMLRYYVGKKFGYFPPEFTEQAEVEWLQEEVKHAAQVGRHALTFPDLPNPGMRTGIPIHETIERLLKVESEPHDSRRCMLAIDTLENFRTGALSYWLDIIPPIAPDDPNQRLEQLLTQEQEILRRIRGAYFLTLRPTLPLHTQWSHMDLSDMSALAEDFELNKSFFRADTGRKELKELNSQLAALADRMFPDAPDYAELRRQPTADLARLVSMLGRHRRPR